MMNLLFAATEPGFELMLERGLPLMGVGMLAIFAVIGVIILVVTLLGKLGAGDGNFTRGLKALFGKKDQ